jgi:hypothetical protein
MSRIHLVGGEKGGVGKSTVARLLAQEFTDRGLPFVALDGDRSHGDLLRFYGNVAQPVDLQDSASADRVLLSAIDANQNVLVDLPAQSASAVKRWIDENDVLELARELDIPIVIWHVMDDSRNSADLLERFTGDYAKNDGVSFVVVKNRGCGVDFSLFDQSPVRKAAEARGAHIIELPGLDKHVMNKIDWLSLSFWAAANLAQGQCLDILERRRVSVWRKHWQQQLEPIADLVYGRPSAQVVQLHSIA